SETNKEFCALLFDAMEKKGHITTRSVEQHYCEKDKMFLPDRFVKGTCPNCGATDQYSDGCERCSATYSPDELIDPACSLCGTPPITKASDHIFFKLNNFKQFLCEWLPAHTPKEVSNKLMEWFDEDLRDWDISRDAPYFGFEIPGHPGKYFYVWLDAPVGYMASTKDWCTKNNRSFDDTWNAEGGELYHFIGKDIVRFHCLFWPAILKNIGMKTPDGVFVHGFLTVNGEKMSKSKGTFVSARTYLNHLDPMYLRFYYACKLNSSSDDIDLSFEDFVSRVNSDMFGKITNLASRGAQMLNKRIDGCIGTMDSDGQRLVENAQARSSSIAKHFEDRNFGKGLLEIREIADEANRYFDNAEPWHSIKTDPEAARAVLSSTLNIFRILAVYLKPILPGYVAKVEKLMNESPYTWDTAMTVLKEGHKINEYEYLASKIDLKEMDTIMEETKAPATEITPAPAESPKEPDYITIDDFTKVDLRVAEIVEAEHIEGADKLLRIKLNLGDESREVMAGIKLAYKPEDLKGRLVVCVANLKPRKMKFGTSEGMILATGTGGENLFLLSPDTGAKPGQKVS
ncbi:MAG: methionine--tRNA ligase, partial [Kiritimatiellae bacterium]|nr:methionine--tRNA ligase [Kiritimatiellia bacterium]